jgi:hypothetical protein
MASTGTRHVPLTETGKSNGKAGTAEFNGTIDRQLTAIRLDDVLHNGHADSVTLDTLIAPDATLEDFGYILWLNANSVIFNAKEQAWTFGRRLENGMRSQQHPLIRPFEGIFKKITQQLL